MTSMQITQGPQLRQKLSQSMIQSVEILQMNARELSDLIEEMSLDNPMLDTVQKAPADENELRLRKLEWLSGLDEQNRAYYRYDREDMEDTGFLENVSGHRTETLADLLRLQLMSGHYTPKQMSVFEYIIASLDERGFFVQSPSQLAEELRIPETDAEQCLDIMRDLEPDGICAAGPKESLLKQIDKREDAADWDVERAIVTDCLELIAGNKLPAAAKALGQPLIRIKEAVSRIRMLNPIPARGFDTGEALHYVTVDITIVKFEDHFEILVNEYGYPQIRVNPYYLKLLRGDCDKETKEYLSEKLRQIEQVQEHITRRNSTLMELAKYLLDKQEPFFRYGEREIRPLRMKDAAEVIGVHESTISRAVRDKYLQCPWGIYPLNFFFSAGVSNEDNEQISNRKIKTAIRELVEEEDKKNPVSDQRLCDLLKNQGISVSRRTVAKYREDLGIGSTRERKEWE